MKHYTSIGIGIAIYPEDAEDVATLIARGDAAMYRSKRGGGERYALHGESTPRASGTAIRAANS